MSDDDTAHDLRQGDKFPYDPTVADEVDPVLAAIDTAYEIIELTQDQLHEASADLEYASHDQVVNIEEYHTLRKAKTIIEEMLDPREEQPDGNDP